MKRSKIEIRDLVSQYQDGPLTQAAFAAQQGISKATLCYWIKKQQTFGNGSFIAIAPIPDINQSLNCRKLYFNEID